MKERIGDAFAHFFFVWSILGALLGLINFGMMVAIFYSTTVSPFLHIPFWQYLGVICAAVAGLAWFVVTIGRPAWGKFNRQLLKLDKADE